MVKVKAWEVTDEFWSRVEPLIPARQRVVDQTPFAGGRTWRPVVSRRDLSSPP